MSETKQKQLEDLFKEVMAENVHTAFRKGSDHPSSYEVWKAIHRMPDEEWGKVVEWMCWALAYSIGNELTLKKKNNGSPIKG